MDENYDFSKLKSSYIVLETIKENYCLEDIIGISILSEDLQYKLFVYEDVLFTNKSLKQYLEDLVINTTATFFLHFRQWWEAFGQS